jgi:two-component system LytT family sensor kinase
LGQELEAVQRYLAIQELRFGARLHVDADVDETLHDLPIPCMILQPLVENAVRHGLEGKEGGGRITITAEDQGAFAEITVEDDGVGIDPEVLADVLAGGTPGEHVGLRNVDARLRQVYGDEHGLVVETNVGSGTLVRMRVPKSQPGRTAASVDPAARPDGRLVP